MVRQDERTINQSRKLDRLLLEYYREKNTAELEEIEKEKKIIDEI